MTAFTKTILALILVLANYTQNYLVILVLILHCVTCIFPYPDSVYSLIIRLYSSWSVVETLSYLNDLKFLTGRKLSASTKFRTSVFGTTYDIQTGLLKRSHTNTYLATEMVVYIFIKSQYWCLLSIQDLYLRLWWGTVKSLTICRFENLVSCALI